MTELITRAEAKAKSLTHYFTGKPCKKGHLSKRNTNSGNCLACTQAWHDNVNPRQRTEWKRANTGKVSQQYRSWAAKNKAYVAARNAEHRAAKLQATPKWLTKEQRSQMVAIYRSRPEGYHVDHIIPLKGENVCGLHVPWNLQHLPADENMRKKNRFS